MANAENKTWTRPKLKVLERGTPEENVLQSCKDVSLQGPNYADCKDPSGGQCAAASRS